MVRVRKTPQDTHTTAKDRLRRPAQQNKKPRKPAISNTPKNSDKSKKIPTRGKNQSDRLIKWTFTHELPSAEDRSKNGRVTGRILVNWGRPRMIEKTLLHMIYESELHGHTLPYDQVAHRLYPGATGDALRQRLDRLRKQLIAEGHVVPPKLVKNETNHDVNVRGYIRKYPGDPQKLLETRKVLFTEPIDDLEFNDPTGYLLTQKGQVRAIDSKATVDSKQKDSDIGHDAGSKSVGEAGESGDDADVESDADADADRDSDSDVQAEGDSDIDHDADLEPLVEAGESDDDADVESDADADADIDSDSDVQTEEDSDANMTEGEGSPAVAAGIDNEEQSDQEAEDEGIFNNTRLSLDDFRLPPRSFVGPDTTVTRGNFADAEDNTTINPAELRYGDYLHGSSWDTVLLSSTPRPSGRVHAASMTTDFTPDNDYASSSILMAVNSPNASRTDITGYNPTFDHLMALQQLNNEYNQRLNEEQLTVNPPIYSAPSEDQEFNNMIVNAPSTSDHSSQPDVSASGSYFLQDDDDDIMDQYCFNFE